MDEWSLCSIPGRPILLIISKTKRSRLAQLRLITAIQTAHQTYVSIFISADSAPGCIFWGLRILDSQQTRC
jgi:hypothetical protein